MYRTPCVGYILPVWGPIQGKQAQTELMNMETLPSTRLFRSDCRKDFYDILQLPKGASESQIKRSYRKLALQYHPVCSSTSCVVCLMLTALHSGC